MKLFVHTSFVSAYSLYLITKFCNDVIIFLNDVSSYIGMESERKCMIELAENR